MIKKYFLILLVLVVAIHASSAICSAGGSDSEDMSITAVAAGSEFELSEIDDSYVKILSVDGGGIRGVIPAMFLKNLEEKLGKPCNEIFDVFAGTSTGGIIAAALTAPNHNFSAADIVRLYDVHRTDIFDPSSAMTGPKYKNIKLRPLLKQYFGKSLLSQAEKPLLLTAYEIERRKPFCLLSHKDCDDAPDLDFKICDVVMATGAAPTYFPPVKINSQDKQEFHFIDGGVFANNPAERALNYAKRLHPDVPEEKFILVSLGTGSKRETIDYGEIHSSGRLGWAPIIHQVMMDGVSQATDHDLRDNHKIKYFRFDSPLKRANKALDDISDENFQNLMLDAEDVYKQHEGKFADLLKLLGG